MDLVSLSTSVTTNPSSQHSKVETHLIDADFGLYILQTLLNDADEGSRGHQSTVDVGLADVALYTKGEG